MLFRSLPYVMTVFSPLSVAADLTESDEQFSLFLEESPRAAHHALDVIADTYAGFVKRCLAKGCWGIFFATTTWGTRERISAEQYEEFGRPYDLRVLKAAQNAPFNILHVCKGNNLLASMVDYPVSAFNWDANDPSNLSVASAKKVIKGKTILAGLHNTEELLEMTAAEVRREALESRKQGGDNRYGLAPGCTVPTRAPPKLLMAMRVAFEGKL